MTKIKDTAMTPGNDAGGGRPERNEEIDDATRARFLRDLKERGEVVGTGDELPPGATHDLDEAAQKLHRRRFSAY